MKTLKNLVAVFVIVAALFSVTTSFAGHVVRGGHGGYDCETDTFRK